MPKKIHELIAQHREHFLKRKLVKHPLLNFKPSTKRIDIVTLFTGITPNTPANLDNQSNSVTTPAAFVQSLFSKQGESVLHNASATVITKIRKIKLEAQDAIHSTGQHALFMGYPCIAIPDEKDKVTKFAPLFLIPIEVFNTGKDVIFRRKKDTSSSKDNVIYEDVKFNSLLAAFIKLLDNIDLPKEATYELNADNFIQNKDDILKNWKPLKNEAMPSLTACAAPNTEELKTFIRGEKEACVYDTAIIGLADFTGAALLDDLTKIEALLRDKPQECSLPLMKLLGNIAENTVELSGNTPNEDSKWVIEKSDPYQEAAVWTQRFAPMMVLQGPPGTGKSQTIVNLIADALAHKQTVLVVCQKKDALTVVKKRMDGVGVGGLANLINDISADRLTTIKNLKSIGDKQDNTVNLEEERQAILKQQAIKKAEKIRHRNALSSNITTLEQNLDAVSKALNETLDGTIMPYRQLKSRLNTVGFMAESDTWRKPLLNAIHQAIETDAVDKISLYTLKTHLIKIQELSDTANTIGYPRNSFSSLTKQLTGTELSDPLEYIKTVQRIAKRIADDQDSLTIQYPADIAWIAEHPFFTAPAEVEGLVYTPYLCSEDQLDNHSDIARFVFALKHLASLTKNIVMKDIMAILRLEGNQKNAALDRIQTVADDVIHLWAINDLLEQIRSNPVFKLLNTHLLGHVNQWQQHVEAIVLHYFLNQLLDKCGNSLAMLPRVEAMRSQLSTALEQKRQSDVDDIVVKFDNKTTAVNTLHEAGLLNERSARGRLKTSLRKLYLEGSESIKETLPILLTGPENASSLLPLQKDLYDLVVIDEASQMYVAEAIPILFRAKKALIAGDIHQMPPSNTFSFAEQDDDGDDIDNIDIDDSNVDNKRVISNSSIDGEYRLLVAAENTLKKDSKHKVSLNVHYRSTRRELIDFSNHAFYEGKLIIPSGNAPLVTGMNTPIVFEQVTGDLLPPEMINGVNKVEAQRIVEWLKKLWLNTTLETRPTVGVIVNNVKQRDYVLECIEDCSGKSRGFAEVYAQEQNRKTADGEDVALFVRSVETVQGDERDVIIYGFTYSGSSRSFGPLITPKFDGRKRLNVAITRSKRCMIVLNSLEISHVSNVAEKDTHERYFVWQYLRYAKAISDNSPESLNIANEVLNQLNPDRATAQATQASTESPFEDEIKTHIESLGYHVTPQVGESGFRIDLGIKQHKNDLNFLCGVECDGARWHSGWTARTRDVWRQDILESKGWKIVRVWSTTWFEHQEQAKLELEVQLAQLQ
ncbi:MAG: hypothetical protein RL344_1015 [Pseudomonadota bacterium]|jgi:very-short-patch-repair endonuclease